MKQLFSLNTLKHIKDYWVAYLVVVIHLPGGIVGNLAILTAVVWGFSHYVLSKSIDLYLVFLLLVPSIVFSAGDADVSHTMSAGILKNIKNVIIIGPLALSTPLALAIATPFRLLFKFNKIKYYKLTAGWFITLLLSVIGLFIAVFYGIESSSGLTVGFRIVLSVGAILVPLAVKDKKTFYNYLDKIMFLSFFLLLIGVISGYWLFITTGFMAYVLFRSKSKLVALVPLLFLLRMILNFDSTITVMATLLMSSLFYFSILKSSMLTSCLRNKYIQAVMIFLPLVLTVYTVNLKTDTAQYDFTTIEGFIKFKLIGDRKPIWDASYEQISRSSVILVPAARAISVYFGYIDKWQDWQNGSHNMYLEMGRQIGVLGSTLLIISIFYFLLKLGRKVKISDELIVYYSFLSVYLIFGLTGQALIYDGAGFFYWLLLGQFFRLCTQVPYEKS